MTGLSEYQLERQSYFRKFAEEKVAPFAAEFDRAECISVDVIQAMGGGNLFAVTECESSISEQSDPILVGLLHEEIGRACSSVRSLLTVQGMVLHALMRWGNAEQKRRWNFSLCRGETLASLCLTEPDAGSDFNSIQTTASTTGTKYILNGRKKWISFGQIAQLMLVFAQSDKGPCAFLLDADTPGITIRPIHGMLGLRASMLAEIEFENCEIGVDRLIGRPGTGLTHVATAALDYGRYTVAWGCVGVAAACLDASMSYACKRKQFGSYLIDQPLIQQMLSHMIANIKAGRLLCCEVARLRLLRDPSALTETSIAKFFTSTMLPRIATDAVQIQGARGVHEDSQVQRYLRDAKVMEIIEGTTQIHEMGIARQAGISWR